MENNNKIHRDLARHLRKNLTTAEQQLWEVLRKRQLKGFRFRRQTPLGRYIADFVCLEARLVIELDGKPHHHQQGYDRERDHWMQEQQFQVLRFWNQEVLDNQDKVLQQICHALHQQMQRCLPPSPLAGEGSGMGACVDSCAPCGKGRKQSSWIIDMMNLI